MHLVKSRTPWRHWENNICMRLANILKYDDKLRLVGSQHSRAHRTNEESTGTLQFPVRPFTQQALTCSSANVNKKSHEQSKLLWEVVKVFQVAWFVLSWCELPYFVMMELKYKEIMMDLVGLVALMSVMKRGVLSVKDLTAYVFLLACELFSFEKNDAVTSIWNWNSSVWCHNESYQ